MRAFLKKYVFVNWWIPPLLYGISLLLFINGLNKPDGYFGLFAPLGAGSLLLVAAIWQLFWGKIVIGLLQLLILLVPIGIFAYMLYFLAAMAH